MVLSEIANSPVVIIYGDDVELYRYSSLTAKTYDCIDFSVDVTDVKMLKIVLQRSIFNDGTASYGLYDATPVIGLAKLMVQR